ncbi:MAG TPA: hypothetical protein PKA82_11755 [Pyrinomonadaceae bacterium]|nr:hypothetical protein [Pyrinomonadaceae bacterium]
MTPFLNYKHFELMTTPSFTAVSKAWTDDEHLQFHIDSQAYNEFLLEYLTADNELIARVIDLEPRHLEYLQSRIEWGKQSIANDEFTRKARAFCREKEAKEKAGKPVEPLPPDTYTKGTDLSAATILAFKLN